MSVIYDSIRKCLLGFSADTNLIKAHTAKFMPGKKNPQPNRNMLVTVIRNCFHGTDFTVYTIYPNLNNYDSSACELSNFIFLKVLKCGCITKNPKTYGTDELFHFAIISQWSGNIISI